MNVVQFMRRLMGLAAWAILALGAGMYLSGSRLAAQRFMTQATGPSRLPAQSDYVREVYGQRLGNDTAVMFRATQILNLAGQREQAVRLRRFFSYCNVQRLLGQDDACTRESVRSAVDGAAGLDPNAQWETNGELDSSFESVLTFSLATEQQLRDGISSPGFWQYHRYESPGVLSYDNAQHVFIFLAARNRSRWEIASFRALLTLPAAHPIELKCDWDPFPFQWPHPLTPNAEVIRVCQQPENLKLSDLLAAIQQAQQAATVTVRLEEFELRNPYVSVTDDGGGGLHHFTLHPATDLANEFAANSAAVTTTNEVQRELKQVNCEKIASCLSTSQSASLAFYDFFATNYLLLPFLIGVLMGIGIGGLLTMSLSAASIVAAIVSVCTVIGIAMAIQTAGNQPPGETRAWAEWGTMGLAVIAIGALLLWIPGLFLGFLLIKWVAGTRGPSPGVA